MIHKGTKERGASFSECGLYRYHLWRMWDEAKPRMCIIGLNPSTADETVDDHTIRKCTRFATREGCGALDMVNLFAFRATEPRVMFADPAPIGDENDEILSSISYDTPMVVVAWGVHGTYIERDKAVWDWLRYRRPLCFGVTKHGHPKHPLYLSAKTPLVAYDGPRV